MLSGLTVDMIYSGFGISASAIAGQAGEVIPYWLQFVGALIVILLSVKPLYLFSNRFITQKKTIMKRTSEESAAEEKEPVENDKKECRAPS